MASLGREPIDPDRIVAEGGTIYDATQRLVKQYPDEEHPDGLPARIEFHMPATSPWFELEVAGQRFRQSVVPS